MIKKAIAKVFSRASKVSAQMETFLDQHEKELIEAGVDVEFEKEQFRQLTEKAKQQQKRWN